MQKRKMVGLLLGALFLFSMLFSPLIATSLADDDGDDDNDIDDSFEDLNHREITVEYLPNGIEIESELPEYVLFSD